MKERKLINEIKNVISLIGITGFVKRLVYSGHEEIMQEIDLAKASQAVTKQNLLLYPIEKQLVPKLALLRKQAGLGGEDPAAEVYEYLNNGCHGILAELEGKIIGYIWWGDHRSNFDFNVKSYGFYVGEISLGPSTAYSFDFFIAPQYRAGGHDLEFSVKYLQALKERGYKKNIGCVHSDNLAALWTYKVFGCKEVKRIIVRRFFLFFLFKNSKYFYDNGIKWLFNTREIYKVNKGFRV